jgi:hypothetical protein
MTPAAHCIPLVVDPRGVLEPWALQHQAWKTRVGIALFQRQDLETARVLIATSPLGYENSRKLGLRQPIALIPNGVALASPRDMAHVQKSTRDISIDYIVRFRNWGPDGERMHGHTQRLTSLFEQLKCARDKLVAHNDLEAIVISASMGEFREGLDEEYFATFQELVNAVHEKWLGGPYPFDDLVGTDVEEFLDLLEDGEAVPSEGSE